SRWFRCSHIVTPSCVLKRARTTTYPAAPAESAGLVGTSAGAPAPVESARSESSVLGTEPAAAPMLRRRTTVGGSWPLARGRVANQTPRLPSAMASTRPAAAAAGGTEKRCHHRGGEGAEATLTSSTRDAPLSLGSGPRTRPS